MDFNTEMPKRLVSQIGLTNEIRIPYSIKTKPGSRLEEHLKIEARLREEEDKQINKTMKRIYMESLIKFLNNPECKPFTEGDEKIRIKAEIKALEKELNV